MLKTSKLFSTHGCLRGWRDSRAYPLKQKETRVQNPTSHAGYSHDNKRAGRLDSIQTTKWFARYILNLLCFCFLSFFLPSSLICYDFVSSTTLEDFLCEKGTVLNLDTVYAIACNLISAVERPQDLGILHNNITTSNLLIGQCPRVSKIIYLSMVC